jgi:hypothetical protein
MFSSWGMVNSPIELETGSSGAFYMWLSVDGLHTTPTSDRRAADPIRGQTTGPGETHYRRAGAVVN